MVSSFKHAKDGLLESIEFSSHVVICIRGKSEPSKIIFSGCVETTRDQDELRIELFENGVNNSVVDVYVFVITMSLKII